MKNDRKFGQNIAEASTLNEIVFSKRNREYGAYDLRIHYESRLTKAFAIGSVLFITGMAAPTIYAKLNPNTNKEIEVKLPPAINPPVHEREIYKPPIPPEEKLPEIPKPSTTKFVPFELVEKPVEVEEVPTQATLSIAPPANVTNVGPADAVEVIIDDSPKPAETIVTIAPKEEDGVVLNVSEVAKYEGGNLALAKFLQKNLKYPIEAAKSGVSGKVYLSFVIDKFGKISDLKIDRGIGFGCDEEAMRVVSLMPNWKPAHQNGNKVKSKFTLPIVFQLE
jgi:periplasmic protein TonB